MDTEEGKAAVDQLEKDPKAKGLLESKIQGLLDNMKRVPIGPLKKVSVPGEPCPQCGRPIVMLSRAQRRSQFHQVPPKALICGHCRLIYT